MTDPDAAPEPDEPLVGADPKDPTPAVMAALVRRTAPSTPEEIAAATGLPVKTVQRTLGRLVAVRDARRAGGGKFTASRHR